MTIAKNFKKEKLSRALLENIKKRKEFLEKIKNKKKK